MPSLGKAYKSRPSVKVPKIPTAGSSGTVKSGKKTVPSYGPQKSMGTVELARTK